MKKTKTKNVTPIFSYYAFTIFLAFFLITARAETKELRILHLNDFHGFLESYQSSDSYELRGGAAVIAWRIKQLRKEKPTLLLAAGDMIQGNTWVNLFEGKPIIKVMNSMHFDAMTLGNHEFDFGKKTLIKLIKEAKFPIISANIIGLGDIIQPYIIKEIDDIKIGIIGLTTQDTPSTTHPKNAHGLTFLSPEKTLHRYLPELRNKVDLIILLTHLGYDTDIKLARKIDDIDIIVGGHSHTKLEHFVTVKNTIIVQAGEHGKFLGMLDLKLENGKIINASNRLEEIIPSKMREDQKITYIINSYKEKVKTNMEKIIGNASSDFDTKEVRIKQTKFGNLVAEIIRKTAQTDVAIINGGSIRASIKKGLITIEDIYSALPFNNYIVGFLIKGRDIKKALEQGLTGLAEKKGGFPQVAGMTFTFAAKRPIGNRITKILINGNPIDYDKTYTIATNDFLAFGGDGYTVFLDVLKETEDFSSIGYTIKSDKIIYNDSGRWLRDLVIEYISKVYEI